jgi:hypothetical protein
VDLPPGTPPPPLPVQPLNNWTPYRDRVNFELTEFLYKTVQMLAGSIDSLAQIMCASIIAHGVCPDNIDLLTNNCSLLETIDSTVVGDAPWLGFTISYEGPRHDEDPAWKMTTYDVWHHDTRQVLHNMLANRDVKSRKRGPTRPWETRWKGIGLGNLPRRNVHTRCIYTHLIYPNSHFSSPYTPPQHKRQERAAKMDELIFNERVWDLR